jgi:hypothetical protein
LELAITTLLRFKGHKDHKVLLDLPAVKGFLVQLEQMALMALLVLMDSTALRALRALRVIPGTAGHRSQGDTF